MLNDAVCFRDVYIVTGYTDLRFGIDSLAALIESRLDRKPFIPDTLYLFCGRKTDRIKGLVWESDGYLLLYKRLEQGNFQRPGPESEVRNLSPQQFHWLMEGLTAAPLTSGTAYEKVYTMCLKGCCHAIFLFCFIRTISKGVHGAFR